MMTNYRGISLMSIAAKLYNKMLLVRLLPLIDEVLLRNQASFRRGRSTVDQICALRRIFRLRVSSWTGMVRLQEHGENLESNASRSQS